MKKQCADCKDWVEVSPKAHNWERCTGCRLEHNRKMSREYKRRTWAKLEMTQHHDEGGRDYEVVLPDMDPWFRRG